MNAAQEMKRTTNALTIDVEDYFQVSAFAPHIDAQRVGDDALPHRAQHRSDSRPAERTRRESDVFYAWLAGAAVPAHRARHQLAGA